MAAVIILSAVFRRPTERVREINGLVVKKKNLHPNLSGTVLFSSSSLAPGVISDTFLLSCEDLCVNV